jgi:outer membrane protein OmpA-like peptidoglycan-associated protein
MWRILSYILIFSLFYPSCKTKRLSVKNGEDAFNRKLYHTATQLLEKEYLSEKNPLKKQNKAMLLGYAYEKNNQPEKAAGWFQKAAKESGNYTSEAYFKLGQMLKMQELYDSAILTFNTAGKLGGNFNIRKEIKSCRDAIKWKNEFSRIRVYNLEKINSPYSDYAPALFSGKLVFTSSRSECQGEAINGWTGEKFGDLFIAGKTLTGLYANAVPFSKELNTTAYDGTACFSADGKNLFFTRCHAAEKTSQYCHIYFSTFDGVNWSEPLMLELFPDTFNVGQPAISKSGKLLVVSSDYNGFGGKDIFYFTKTDTGWSKPSNASGTVNTPGDEMFPWLDEKDNLYFASNGLPGMGGLDIFKATRMKNGWKQAENLKSPINSGADDFAYIIEKYKPHHSEDTVLMSGFFSSSRKGGKGSDDLYRFEELWLNLYEVRGRVVAKQYENPENPESRVLGMAPLRLAKCELRTVTGDSVAAFITDTGGAFFFTLQPNTSYNIIVSRNEYFSNSAPVSTVGKKSRDSLLIIQYVEIELEKIFTTKEIVIPNIYYDYDKATLRPESKTVLDSLVVFFKVNNAINVEIGSHTDSRGSDEYNQKLSQARAQSVVDYLIEKGIDRLRLIAKGYGESRPVNGCTNGVNCSEEEHQKNRRTTFRVTATHFTIESVEPTQIRIDPKPGEEDDEETE